MNDNSYALRRSTRTLAVVVAFALLPAVASADRVLIRDHDATVTLEDGVCAAAMDIAVQAESPDMFESPSARLQRLVDAAQAILRYECEMLDALHVSGRLSGLDEPVYDGVANAVDDWVLVTRRSVSATGASAGEDRKVPPPNRRRISVASVQLDMPVDAVRRNVAEVFGSEPRYDSSTGILRLEGSGCSAEVDVPRPGEEYRRPGANCVTGWFTDRRQPTLFRFRYTQAADGGMEAVRDVLVENFGQPREDAWNEAGEYRSLSWTSPTGADTPSEILQARLFRDGGLTVIDIVLADPRLTGGDRPASSSNAGVELKL